MNRWRMICCRLLTFGILATWCLSLGVALGQRNRSEVASDLIRRMDQNGDGKLDQDEIPRKSREAISRLAEQAGLEEGKPWSVRRLERQLRRSRRRESNGDSDESATPSTSPRASVSEPFRFGSSAKSEGGSVQGFGSNEANGKPLEETYDPRVLNYVDNFMRRYDRNENGQLDADEWGRVRWGSDPKESDKNGDGILTRAEMSARMAKRWGSRSRGRSRRDEASSSSKPTKASSGGSDRSKVDGYAKSLLRQYDTNGNGLLEKDEWSKMKSRYAKADANKDGVITSQELAQQIGNFGKQSRTVANRTEKQESRSSRGSRRETSRRRDRRDREREPESKKSYRFLTATERLADALSDRQQESFIKLDRNGDGQIAMNEFARVWSDSKVKEFNRLDRNLDGLVTPSEYVAKD